MPPIIRGMKKADFPRKMKPRWRAVETPKRPTNAQPAVTEGLYA